MFKKLNTGASKLFITPSNKQDKMSCECPICYDAITAETGHSQLSCGHKFHMACITRWFFNQDLGVASTCAMCRKAMGSFEDIPTECFIDAGDEDESEGDEGEEEDIMNPPNLQELAAAERLRARFAAMDERAREFEATIKIQAVARGFLAREMVYQIRCAEEDLKDAIEILARTEIKVRQVRAAAQMGNLAWKNHVISKVKAVWRGFKARRVFHQMRTEAIISGKISLTVMVSAETA